MPFKGNLFKKKFKTNSVRSYVHQFLKSNAVTHCVYLRYFCVNYKRYSSNFDFQLGAFVV